MDIQINLDNVGTEKEEQSNKYQSNKVYHLIPIFSFGYNLQVRSCD